MKKQFARVFLAMVLLVSLVCTAVPVCAASNVCQQISGDAEDTVTFEVTTDSNFFTGNKVKISATKGVIDYTYSSFGQTKEKTGKMYAYYDITVKGSGYKKSYTLKGSSISLSFPKAGTTYTVTVKPWSISRMNKNGALLNFFAHLKLYKYWEDTPTWKIKSTSGLTFCD